MNNIEILKNWISGSDNIVFFGGAGVSTESGIPDFRSEDGIYNKKYAFPPEMILSHSFFMSRTSEFYEFYKDKMIYRNAAPNKTHRALAELEAKGKLKAVITQNIDGLHQAAGSVNVLELHGSVHRNHCMNCGRAFSLDEVMNTRGVPKCDCGGIVKPDVVLYEEGLSEETLALAVSAIKNADVLIVGGTSLSVYPAAGLVNYYSGAKLVLINKTQTPYDNRADLLIGGSIGDVICQAV